MFVRTPESDFLSLDSGRLRLIVRPESITDLVNPSAVVRRQQHQSFHASCELEFEPAGPSEAAGLVLLQNNDHHVRLMLGAGREVTLVRRIGGQDEMLAKIEVGEGVVGLGVEAHGQEHQALVDGQPLGAPFDGRFLSTPVAGGFTGVHIGLYATSDGVPSESWADFSGFTYRSCHQ
jgi:alpha-N-arabinofuranosidase